MERDLYSVYKRAQLLNISSDCFWTELEINILKEYYPKEGSKCIDKLPRKSIKTIQAMANKLNINFVRWLPYEDDIIMKFYPLYGAKKCKEELPNKNIHNITDRANVLKISYIDWTPEEIEIIKNNTGYHTANEWQKLIPRKSYTAIKNKAKEIGVNITSRNNLWSEEEDNIIKKYYISLHGDLEEMLPGRTKKNIAQRARKLGIELLNRWTKEDTQFLIENYLEKGAAYCARYLNRSEGVIKAYARKNGLHQAKHKIICLELKKVYDTQFEILKELNITSISHALKNGGTAGGYHFCYEEHFLESKLSAEEYIRQIDNTFHRSKKVLCVETNEIFNSAKEAMEAIGIKGIDACCRGKQKTAGGYHWKYIEAKEYVI